MKILLLGDYSGLHKNLKIGLQKLGHKVTIASNGDFWKKIDGADIPLYPNISFLRKIHFDDELIARLQPKIAKLYLKYVIRPENYDIVHSMSGNIFYLTNNRELFDYIKSKNENFFCALSGDDYYTYKAWEKGIYKYCCYDDNPEFKQRFDIRVKPIKDAVDAYVHTLKIAKKLIPTNAYENEEPYKELNNLSKCITYPLDLDNIKYTSNVVKDKIVIYHGINRELDKGSNYIVEAMDMIKSKYPNDVECIITKKIPFKEYTKILNKTNIYIDQCKSYFYGMSGVMAMAMGKVVLSGKEPEAMRATNEEECPVFNIVPDTKQIFDTLEYIIKNKEMITDLGLKGRMYVSKYHDAVKIAKEYLNVWTNEIL